MKMNERIRARRKELKLTQAVLAKLVGVNRGNQATMNLEDLTFRRWLLR